MTRMAKRLVTSFLRDESGVASVEFVLVVPIFLAVFMASFESGSVDGAQRDAGTCG